MQKLIFVLAIFISVCSYSAEILPVKSIKKEKYTIVSDIVSNRVPKGSCLVRGKVTFWENPVEGALIATLDRKKECYTDADGNYEFYITDKDTTIFFFNQDMEEIVIWSYPFKSSHVVTINFFATEDFEMIEVDKPVIYLYNEEPISVDLKFDFNGDLSFAYPAYENGWNVTVDNESMITDNTTKKSYPYLFWEGEMASLNFEIKQNTFEGFLVASEDVVSFLEETLTKLGLNSKEQTDFITFWAPKMIQSDHVLVQFFIDKKYESKIAELDISPLPESMRRIYMVYSPLESSEVPYDVIPQELPAFERKGFTLIEWGGSQINTPNLIP